MKIPKLQRPLNSDLIPWIRQDLTWKLKFNLLKAIEMQQFNPSQAPSCSIFDLQKITVYCV